MKIERDWQRIKHCIVKRYKGGASIGELCAHYHTGHATMKRLLEEWGADLRQDEGKAKTERNERIVKLAKEGHSDIDIAEAIGGGITRNAIVGVRNRNGLLRDPSESRRNRRRSMNGKRQLTKPFTVAPKAKPRALVELEKIAAAPRPATTQIEASMAAAWRDSLVPPAPAKPAFYVHPGPNPTPIEEITRPAPPSDGKRWVTFEERTGCAWIEGDGAGRRYCNAPRCRIKRVGFPYPERVAYCEEHWIKRRAPSSRNTRIVA